MPKPLVLDATAAERRELGELAKSRDRQRWSSPELVDGRGLPISVGGDTEPRCLLLEGGWRQVAEG